MIYIIYPFLVLRYFWEFLNAFIIINHSLDIRDFLDGYHENLYRHIDFVSELLILVFTLPVEVIEDFKRTEKLEI